MPSGPIPSTCGICKKDATIPSERCIFDDGNSGVYAIHIDCKNAARWMPGTVFYDEVTGEEIHP
jgi:hypothetical protein